MREAEKGKRVWVWGREVRKERLATLSKVPRGEEVHAGTKSYGLVTRPKNYARNTRDHVCSSSISLVACDEFTA